MFENKTLLITGGTGSFGTAVLDKFLNKGLKEIRIFSRDEKKHEDMRQHYHNSKIKYFVGDVRDLRSIKDAMSGVDYVFHAAALKQVPSCEHFPLEAMKTNVRGTDNVLSAAIEAGVKRVICLSTDKAVYPISAMGMSKAIMEKVFIAKARVTDPAKTVICGTRFGNVLCSRGSVVPLLIDQIKEGRPMTVTDPTMTRYIMTLDEAVELVVFAFEHAKTGDIMVQKSPACTIETLVQAIKNLFDPKAKTEIIGIRQGEKNYEHLLSKEECASVEDLGHCYRIPADMRALGSETYMSSAMAGEEKFFEYINSDNSKLLTLKQVEEKLLSTPYIKAELVAWKKVKA